MLFVKSDWFAPIINCWGRLWAIEKREKEEERKGGEWKKGERREEQGSEGTRGRGKRRKRQKRTVVKKERRKGGWKRAQSRENYLKHRRQWWERGSRVAQAVLLTEAWEVRMDNSGCFCPLFFSVNLRVSLLRKMVWCSSSELEPWSKTT